MGWHSLNYLSSLTLAIENMIASLPPDQTQENYDRILVIDNDRASFITSILSLEGYEVDHHQTGERGLVHLYQQPPHLVISNQIILPSTGQSLCQQIRILHDLPYIPILLIADQTSPDLVQGLDSGADDFLRQPLEVDELLARVRSLLRMKHSIDSREHITQVREEFLSRLTHDLRTPLVAADRMFDRLTQGKYGELNHEVLQVLFSIQSNNQDLLQMTNTLLDIYRYEAGSKTLSFTVFDIRVLLESILRELRPLASSKKIQLTLMASGAAGQSGLNGGSSWSIHAAKLEIRRMLTNIVSNAIKYTDQGEVKVSLDVDSASYQIQIRDTGCGISAADLPNIFNRFYQGRDCRSGHGLGLNLVHQIISAHQGTIEVESHLNQGTCFTLNLPISSSDHLSVLSQL